MNKIVFSLAAAGLAFLAAITVLVIVTREGTKDSDLASGLARRVDQLVTEATATRARMEELVERVDSLELALEARRAPGSPGPSAIDDPEGEHRVRENSEPDKTGATVESLFKNPEALAAALEGEGAQRLRDFVFDVVREERTARRDEQTQRARQRRQEWKEMQKGPYGKYNYKVNSLAKKLELNGYQKQFYYDLLVGYKDRFTELRKGVDWKNEEARDSYERAKSELTDQFSREFVQVLSPPQVEAYDDLSNWEKAPEGGMALSFQTAGDGVGSTFIRAVSIGGDGPVSVETTTLETTIEATEGEK